MRRWSSFGSNDTSRPSATAAAAEPLPYVSPSRSLDVPDYTNNTSNVSATVAAATTTTATTTTTTVAGIDRRPLPRIPVVEEDNARQKDYGQTINLPMSN